MKLLKYLRISTVLPVLFASLLVFQSCSTFNYKTYVEQKDADDPEPNYDLTLNPDFQEYTSYMFIGNRIENFGTYFNTFFNARENYDEAYDDYVARVLANYSERLDSIYAAPSLSQESKDKFNKALEKASKVIQYHKSSAFMDQAVLLIGKSYFYLGDYLKAERKFSEFISKLSKSAYIEEALLFLARTQLRLGNNEPALARLNDLIANSKDKAVVAAAYQSLAEYYINLKDYESSIKNYSKSIEYSNDNEFKAQMQFLIASVNARQSAAKGAAEFLKVLNYSTTFELEFLARHNYVKNLILSNNLTSIIKLIDQLDIDYKDNPEYLPDISYLRAMYYEQKKNYKEAVKHYKEVIVSYPKSVASSDASYILGDYYENEKGDYLTALWYYRYSGEENASGHYKEEAAGKLKIYSKYFELRSVIAGVQINTGYDTTFLQQLKPELKQKQEGIENFENPNKGKGDLGPGGLSSDSSHNTQQDSLGKTSYSSVDSLALRAEKVAKAKFELAELFIFDISKPDSAEKYLKESYDESADRDFKCKVLYALADLYRNTNRTDKYEAALKEIIADYPVNPVANECRKLLNIPVEEEILQSSDDSIYFYAEKQFTDSRYSEALDAFRVISENYSASLHASKANYAIGWIYENVLSKPDSAFIYYSKIGQDAPSIELYSKIYGKITEYKNSLAGNKDSLGTQDSLTVKDSTGIIDTSWIKIQDLDKQPVQQDNGELQPEQKKQDLPEKNLDMKKEGEEKPEDPTKNK